MKKFNRLCELKLRDAELLLTVAFVLYRIPVLEIPGLRAKIDEAWRLLLVNQFHDVLPGSSIELVHTEAKKWFRDSLSLTQQVIDKCVSFFGGHSTNLQDCNCLLNTLPWKRNALMYDGINPINSVELEPMSFNVLSNKLNLTPLLLGKSEFLHYFLIKHFIN
jgi:alpha-mannosidase